jgi:hypothetical protein
LPIAHAIPVILLAAALLLAGCSSGSDGSYDADPATCVASDPYTGGAPDCAGGGSEADVEDYLADKMYEKQEEKWEAQRAQAEFCATSDDPEICGGPPLPSPLPDMP